MLRDRYTLPSQRRSGARRHGRPAVALPLAHASVHHVQAPVPPSRCSRLAPTAERCPDEQITAVGVSGSSPSGTRGCRGRAGARSPRSRRPPTRPGRARRAPAASARRSWRSSDRDALDACHLALLLAPAGHAAGQEALHVVEPDRGRQLGGAAAVVVVAPHEHDRLFAVGQPGELRAEAGAQPRDATPLPGCAPRRTGGPCARPPRARRAPRAAPPAAAPAGGPRRSRAGAGPC